MGGSHEWPEWRSRVTVAQYGNLRAPISFFGTVATNVMGPKCAMSPTWSLYKIAPLYSTHSKVSEAIVRMKKFQPKLPKMRICGRSGIYQHRIISIDGRFS